MKRITIIDRYILRELVPPFFLSMATLTLLLLIQRLFRLAELVLSKGATLWSAVQLILYILPGFILMTAPMSILVASVTAFARLSADAEVTALKSSGVSLLDMIRPTMLFAAVLFLFTAGNAHFIAPMANAALKVHLFAMVKSKTMVGIEQGVFSSTFDGMVIYVDRMKSLDDMTGIFISDERNAGEPYAIVAGSGQLITDPAAQNVTLAMRQGSVHLPTREGQPDSLISFASGKLNLDISHALMKKSSAGRNIEEQSSMELVRALTSGPAGPEARFAEIELYKRLSATYACLLFGFIGAPFGIRRGRSGKSAGIAIAIGVFLAYYLLLATGARLAQTQALNPLPAYWLPNLVCTLAAAGIVFWKHRELRFGLPVAFGSLFRRGSGSRRPRP